MYNENEKSKYYRQANNNPVPVRFGGLKPLIQQQALAQDKSMNWMVKKMAEEYLAKRGLKVEIIVEED